MLGPRALDPGYVSPAGAGPRRGPSFRRLVLLLVVLSAVVWVIGSQPVGVRAESFGGTSTNGCVTGPVTLYSGSAQGFSRYEMRFHVAMADAATITWRWEYSSGQVGYMAWLHGPIDWWVMSGNLPYQQSTGTWEAALVAQLSAGSVGTIRFVVMKAAPYGGCFTINNVMVTRTPALPPSEGGPGPTPPPGGGGFATPAPTPTGQTPEPGATTTAAPSGSCVPTNNEVPTASGCEPPPGYCWGFGPSTGVGTWPIVPCGGSPSPSPTPTPTAPPAVHWRCQVVDGGADGRLCTDQTPYVIPVGATVSVAWTIDQFTGDGNIGGRKIEMGFCTVVNATTAIGSGTCFSVRQPSNMGSLALCTSGTTECSGTMTNGQFLGSQSGWTTGRPWTMRFWCGQSDWYYTTRCTGIPTVLAADGTPLGADGQPLPSATPTPTATPSGAPTIPPGYYPPGFSTPDPDASGPADVNICPATGPTIAACATLGPDGTGDIFSSYNPDPSGFIGALSEKAPFGFVAQFGDAVGGALDSPGSAMPDLCHEFTLGPLGSFEFCVPEEPFDYLVTWRWLLVGLVWLAGIIGLYRIASASVGGGDE